MPIYNVALSLSQSDPVQYEHARRVAADTHRDAAPRALDATGPNSPERIAFLAGRDVFAWAWTDSAPKYENGAPMVVHGMTLRRGDLPANKS